VISILIFPFLLCLILVFVHVYFGAYILKRGILFIDLALAQWAALGYLMGIAFHVENSIVLFLCGFSATVLAALILALLKPLFEAVNLQEAIIGVMYILASALALAFISSTGIEMHHLQEMFTGHLLFVQFSDVLITLGLYGFVGLLCYFFHSFLFQNRSQIAEFLFYSVFGLVVTSSVKLVGLLLVFSFLVLPILSIILFVSSLKMHVCLGWLVGIVASCLGLILSMRLDIPPSLCVILVLCVMLVVGIGGFLSLNGWYKKNTSINCIDL